MKWLQWAAVVGLISLAPMAGCWSAYHRSSEQFAFSTTDRLDNRLAEARAAAKDALHRVWDVRDGKADADALGAAAWELERRTASVRDVAARTVEPAGLEAALADLDAASAALGHAAQALDEGTAEADRALDDAEEALRRAAGGS